MKSQLFKRLLIHVAPVLFLSLTPASTLHLTGVTLVPNHPRAEVYTSFFHELIAEIADVSQFTYNLRTIPNAKYGAELGQSQPDGLIGEVYSNRADFVIADLEITPERAKFLHFTRPYMRSKLAALVRKDSPALRNEPTTVNETLSNSKLRDLMRKSKRTVIRDSITERYFRTSKNPLVYHMLPSIVANFQVGLNQLNQTADLALLSDSARLDLIAATECNLAVVTSEDSGDVLSEFVVEYAIGLRDNSPFIAQMENGLKVLEDSGRLSALIEQHWTDYCDPQTTHQADNGADGQSLEFEETNGSVTAGHFSAVTLAVTIGSVISYLIWA